MSSASRQPAVLVAGGTGALGAAVLGELLDGGYPVTATWVVEKERERVERDFGGREELTLRQADLMDERAVEDVVGGVDRLGAVVNLVGGFAAPGKVHESSIEDFEDMLRLNLRPTFLLARAAMPRLAANGGGAFVAVSARPALRPFPGAAGYITAKAGVLALIQALDAEYRNDGVRCNAILPSVIDTPANRASQPDADHSKWVPPQQIAKVVRFLVSDDSTPTSGAGIPVYGRA
jgi:NAD(P)-dependent dehydrogenase (short-subunit alcohol dehydrogenase family)